MVLHQDIWIVGSDLEYFSDQPSSKPPGREVGHLKQQLEEQKERHTAEVRLCGIDGYAYQLNC